MTTAGDVRRAAGLAAMVAGYAAYLAAAYWYERARGRRTTLARLILNNAGNRERRAELMRQEHGPEGTTDS